MSLYEHAEEPMPPNPEYDPAMDHPEPEPSKRKRKRKSMPFIVDRQDYGARRYLMTDRIIVTFSRRYCKYAIIMQRMTNEPYLTVDRKDVAKLIRHWRKEASC